MHSSVSEIARSATHASAQSEQSVRVAGEASSAMGTLKHSGAAIGNLASAISSIASQTRLLALNATIEAARAGDMGRGFAVVAHEVKELARVTDETTKRITKEAQTISTDTLRVESLITSIMSMTTQVGQSQSTIAVATQEQEAAVSEMSRQVQSIVHETQARIAQLGQLNVDVGRHFAKAV
jgi:methyl-accepting chemotaxis protein